MRCIGDVPLRVVKTLSVLSNLRARDKNRKAFVLHEARVVELQFNAIWYDQYKLVNCTKTKKIK
jgi:hypothetical protein